MAIISVSLNEKILEEIDNLQRELGFSGRSEVIRAGARMLIADNKEKEELVGMLNCVLLLIHSQKAEEIVTEIKHEFEDIINTQIHSHMKEGKCLETFIIQGEADRVKYLLNLFQTNDKMEYVKLIVA
ncbi:MAG: CopG family ribbon-helix-helix protein [Halobacteriota archaeon]|nr:CopG family ribbon-helix-helix protein [Halobacteriota archaeon]